MRNFFFRLIYFLSFQTIDMQCNLFAFISSLLSSFYSLYNFCLHTTVFVQPREIVNEKKKAIKKCLKDIISFFDFSFFFYSFLFVKENEMGRKKKDFFKLFIMSTAKISFSLFLLQNWLFICRKWWEILQSFTFSGVDIKVLK